MNKGKVLICVPIVLMVCAILLFMTGYQTGSRYQPKEHSSDKMVNNNKNLTYYYEWNNKKGKPFHPKTLSLDSIGFPLSNFVTITDSILNEFVFVTAANKNYFKPALEGVANIQKHFPRKTIIFYDIGLFPEQIAQVCFLTEFYVYIFFTKEIMFLAALKTQKIMDAF